MTPVIDLSIESGDWASLEDPQSLAGAVIRAAIERTGVGLADGAEISIVLCDDSFIAELNRKWRGLDKPTNVLSFPAGGDIASAPILGDIVIAFETASNEALEAEKPLRDHVAHLLAHGFLHLIGYDHIEEAEALAMEALERDILARLGIDDPYRDAVLQATKQR